MLKTARPTATQAIDDDDGLSYQMDCSVHLHVWGRTFNVPMVITGRIAGDDLLYELHPFHGGAPIAASAPGAGPDFRAAMLEALGRQTA